MSYVVPILFGIVVLTGIIICGIGFYTYREWNQVGTTSLTAAIVLLGFCGIVSGSIGLVFGPEFPEEFGQPLWAGIGFIMWTTAAVPWFLFVVSYTGWYTKIRWRTVVALYIPIILTFLTIFIYQGATTPELLDVMVSIAIIYSSGLAFISAFLLVHVTRSYVHLSAFQGYGLSFLPIVLLLSLNSVSILQQAPITAVVAMHTLVFVVGAFGFVFALVWRPLLAVAPAVERLGDRAIINDTDDLMFIVDSEDQVVKCNDAAVAALSQDREEILGYQLTDILGYGSETLDARETITLETSTEQHRYDPGVSTITHGTGTSLGTVLGLRDVTKRELREARLSVLNRVLRHNLRNKVDIVKSRVEILEAEFEDPSEHVAVIDTVADDIAELGYNARQIDKFVSDGTETTEVNLCEMVEDMVSSLDTDGVTVSVDCPEKPHVTTQRQALEAALDSAIDNAIKYGSSQVEIVVVEHVDGYEISIVDDGPGIPQSELDSLDAGIESPLKHGTGLGLWQLKWSVTTMGGNLEFETDQGTTVRFVVPNQADEILTE